MATSSLKTRCRLLAVLVALVASAAAHAGLTPDQLVLVVNKNVPDSRRLAEYYAATRHVPDGRILELDLPFEDQITFDQYERDVVPAVRKWLIEHKLHDRTTCLVTFYGVPLRIRGPKPTTAESNELKALDTEAATLTASIATAVDAVEKLAKERSLAFTPAQGDHGRRAQHALSTLAEAGRNLPPEERGAFNRQIVEETARLAGLNGVIVLTAPTLNDPRLPADQRKRLEDLRTQAEQIAASIPPLQARRFDPEARKALRDRVKALYGPIAYVSLLQGQAGYLRPAERWEDNVAAVDNELALLWWDVYPRARWIPNPLSHRFSPAGRTSPTLMVARLDGPDRVTVEQLIDTSIAVERTGLSGTVAIDSRGIPATQPDGKQDAYGVYDQNLRDFAAFLKQNTTVNVVLEETQELFPPRSVPDTALYCGWYRLRSYVPGMRLKPGSVGYHVASLELVSLRGPMETGWCRGLLKDGIAATLGAVSEPYLHSFPPAADFFPVLMTGKLTLAETYWRTSPLASWMITLIGDPLYRPYAVNPPVKPEQLSPSLRRALDDQGGLPQPAPAAPATRPATKPAIRIH